MHSCAASLSLPDPEIIESICRCPADQTSLEAVRLHGPIVDVEAGQSALTKIPRWLMFLTSLIVSATSAAST